MSDHEAPEDITIAQMDALQETKPHVVNEEDIEILSKKIAEMFQKKVFRGAQLQGMAENQEFWRGFLASHFGLLKLVKAD